MTGSGLYLHVPFCSAICPYCDFAVTTGGADKRRAFAAALIRELALRAEMAQRFGRFDTIYFGGGTPSALESEWLASVLNEARSRLSITSDAWISLEVNPEDVTEASARAWRGLGVRTVSLGVQSFDDDELKFLGRRHRRAEAERAIAVAKDAGFDIVSVDLIFGLPEQDLSGWEESLRHAVQLGVDHVSCYQLTIHEGTPFAKRKETGRIIELGDSQQADLFEATRAVLEDEGFLGYEVSNFARTAAHRSRHNDKYWRHVPYIGVGPSAHSFDGRTRFWNERDTAAWQASLLDGRLAVAGEEALSDEDLALEAIMLRLRTLEGLDLEWMRERFGVDLFAENESLIGRYVDEGMARLDGGSLVLTPRGLSITDSVAASLKLG